MKLERATGIGPALLGLGSLPKAFLQCLLSHIEFYSCL